MLIAALQNSRFLWNPVAVRQTMMIARDLSSSLCPAPLKLANSSSPRSQETSVINCKMGVCLSFVDLCFRAPARQGNYCPVQNDGWQPREQHSSTDIWQSDYDERITTMDSLGKNSLLFYLVFWEV